MDHPQVPLDNNAAENALRGPVNGRKNYYGSASLWSAQLAAMLFAILQTLELSGINTRHWLTAYLNACADNGRKAPQEMAPFLPWSMDEARRAYSHQPTNRPRATAGSAGPCAVALELAPGTQARALATE